MKLKDMKLKRRFLTSVFAFPLLFGGIFLNNNVHSQEQKTLEDIQQIVAIVDDKLISIYDLKQRALLFMMSSGIQQVTPEEQKYLTQQALQSLIDERLKIEALFQRAKMRIPAQEKEQQFNDYARQMRVTPKELNERLKKIGIEKKSLLKQIEGGIAWNRFVGGVIMPDVNISDDEIYTVLDRFKANKGQDEIHYKEIFLLVSDNAQKEPTRIAATKIVENLRGKASFKVIAQQFSQSSTAAVGGDLSWVMKSDIAKDILVNLEALNSNEISDPIETEDGFYILQLVGKRKVLTADPLDTVVDLKYLYFPADDASSAKSMASANTKAVEAMKKITGCKQLEDKKTPFGSDDAATLGKVKVSTLPADLQNTILDLEVGKATSPIKEDGGYRLFVACDKEVPTDNELTYEAVEDSLSRQRVNLIAKRYLRDLRRDAIIDYR